MKKISVVLILLLLAAALSACWGQAEIEQDPNVLDDQSYEPETVYIGSVLPLTGSDGQQALLLQAAQETAVEIINGAHNVKWDVAEGAGISGYGASQVELVFADSGSEEIPAAAGAAAQPAATAAQPAATAEEEESPAAAAARQLIDMGVVSLIGAYRTQPTADAASVAANAGMPLLTGTASLDSITDGESYDFDIWFNRIAPTVDMHSQLFFSYIRQLNLTQEAAITSVALAYKDDYFGREVLRTFDEQAAAYGLQVVGRIAYKDGGDDLATVAYRMMANQPQAVFHYGDDADLTAFAKLYGAAKFAPQAAFCYGSTFQNAQFREAALAAKADYWHGLSALLTTCDQDADAEQNAAGNSDIISGDVRLIDYINAIYRQKTGEDMDNEALYDFAAVIVMAQAVGIAGSTDPELLATALRETDFDAPYLASGHISFSETGQNQVNTGYLTRLTEDGYILAFKP